MLVDVNLHRRLTELPREGVLWRGMWGRDIERIDRGLYWGRSLMNYLRFNEMLESDEPLFDSYMEQRKHQIALREFDPAGTRSPSTLKFPADVGVCDRFMQVLRRNPEIETDPRPMIVGFNLHVLPGENQGGARWYKQGEYIGTNAWAGRDEYMKLNRKHDLYSVLHYHVLQVREEFVAR